jgi:hypothetical protein
MTPDPAPQRFTLVLEAVPDSMRRDPTQRLGGDQGAAEGRGVDRLRNRRTV